MPTSMTSPPLLQKLHTVGTAHGYVLFVDPRGGTTGIVVSGVQVAKGVLAKQLYARPEKVQPEVLLAAAEMKGRPLCKSDLKWRGKLPESDVVLHALLFNTKNPQGESNGT